MRALKTITTTDSAMLITLCCLIALSMLIPMPDSSQPTPAEPTIIGVPVAALEISQPEIDASQLPDFTVYQDVRTKKAEFFNYMLPMIRHANDKIRARRLILLALREDARDGIALDAESTKFVANQARKYRIPQTTDLYDTINLLLDRVDIVPASLVLAQAANESGWGTSRFARKANNLFGVWCFTEGCGLTPLYRDEGLTHEVARYESVQHSVEAYMHTINTNRAYRELRAIRADSRADEQYIRGLELAEGLMRYSERGLDYVREIQQMIRVNNLQQYTLPLQEQA